MTSTYPLPLDDKMSEDLIKFKKKHGLDSKKTAMLVLIQWGLDNYKANGGRK